MQKAGALLLILFLGLPFMLFAQEENEPSIDDWDNYTSDLYTRGDQTFTISLGVGFPLFFVGTKGGKVGNVTYEPGEHRKNNIVPAIGGAGTLTYCYYFNSMFFIGADLGLLFFPTIAKNTVYMTSLGAKAGTQLILGRFEFPVSVTIGMTIHTYLNSGYFGMYMKGGASAFFRATHEWSFGLTSNYCWYPQWTEDPAKSIDGHFVDLILSARYHF